jgi:hypothetical protein
MGALRMTRKMVIILFLAFLVTSQVYGQFPWQTAVKRDPSEAKRIVGLVGQREPSRDLNIV